MAALTSDVKLFIVQALACFDAPSQVQDQVKQAFRLTVSLQQLSAYDPNTVAGKRMSDKLKAVFYETREAFKKDTGEIAIANQTYRLRVLNRLLIKAESSGNASMAAQLLEQAAKESGGSFTNRRELTGAKGGPIQAATQTTTMSPEQFREIAKQVADEV